MPKVSVVIATHNRASLLRRAVTSVLAQTNEDFEIVVADDASSDDTCDVVQSFGDRRIKYIRHDKNCGVSNARNTAIANADGEYIAFLDDDDEWLPRKLEMQLDHMKTLGRSVGAICCGHYEIDDATNRILTEIKPSLRGWIFERLLTQGFFNHTSTMLVRTECFQTVGLFDPEYRYGEDFDMWLRLAKQYEFDFVDQSLVKLHFQASGLTQNYGAIVSGAEMHLSSYREFFEQNPRVYADRLHRLGTYYCFAGDLRNGRNAFRRALKLHPTFLKGYASLALSTVGPRAFKLCYETKDRIGELSADLKWSSPRKSIA